MSELRQPDPTSGVSTVESVPKPLVILIPDHSNWVLGTWAREIADYNAGDFDFAIFPQGEIERRPVKFAELVRAADIVHCLSPWAFASVEARIRTIAAGPVALIGAIHHIEDMRDVRPCFVADRIAVMSEQVRDALVAEDVPRDKLFLLRKGVDTGTYRHRDSAESRKRLGLPEGEFIVGFSGKAASDYAGRKGVDVLREALVWLSESGDCGHLAVTGPGWESKLGVLAPPGVAVHYFPFLAREAMPDFFNAIDVYLNASRVEGGPLPPFEAMSCGTPVVSTPVGMVRDLVRDGVDGLLFPIGDANAAARAVRRLRFDPGLARTLGGAGRETVVRHLGAGSAARAARELYGSVRIVPGLAEAPRPSAFELDHWNEALRISDEAHWLAAAGPPERPLWIRSWDRLRRLRAMLSEVGSRGVERELEIAYVDLNTMQVPARARILDLGCGVGQLSIPLLERGYRTVSVDPNVPRLRALRASEDPSHPAPATVRADGRTLPCPDASFDVVMCREVIEHIEHPEQVVREIRRVLAPGGKVCVTTPSAHTERYFQWVDRRWLAMAGHVNVFSRPRMRRLLESNGLRVREIRGRGCFYTLFWFLHTLAGTTHDGTGRIENNHRLESWIRRGWDLLGTGPLKRAIEAIGDRILPKSYVYYCEADSVAARESQR